MDFNRTAFELWSATESIRHLVRLTLEVHELEAVRLHLLNPARLAMRQMGRGRLEE